MKFARRLPWPLLALCLTGCPIEHDDKADPPPMGGTPAKARQACHDYVSHAAEMIHRVCDDGENASPAELEDAIEAQMVQPCDEADGLRDAASFNDECLPGLDALEVCPSAANNVMPPACSDQIQFAY